MTPKFAIGEIVIVSGHYYQALESQLRKRPGDDDSRQIVRWSECPWQPKALRNSVCLS